MRNIKANLIILLSCSIMMAGCGATKENSAEDIETVSVEEYNKVVEERDYYKEQYELSEKQNATTITHETGADEIAENDISENYTYSLEGMTSDEIVREVVSIINNRPVTGQTPEEYKNSLGHDPLSDSSFNFEFCKDADLGSDINAVAHIDKIIISNGVRTQMDGTLNVDENYLTTEIYLHLVDYDTASKVYDKLYDVLSPYVDIVYDRREGTRWMAMCQFASRSDYFLILDKTGDESFSLSVKY